MVTPSSYEFSKHSANARNRQKAHDAQDCSHVLHPPVDPERRESCRLDLRRFCETYHSERYSLAWSPDHLKVIGILQKVVLEGGQMALAMPRSSGKSTLTRSALQWALLYGHHHYQFIVAASAKIASRMLSSVRHDLSTLRLLEEDFSEVVGPLRALNGEGRRATGQHIGGERTKMRIATDELTMPTVAGSPASGAVIIAAGILGSAIRGANREMEDGTVSRPTLVLIDDFQTDQSARSSSSCARRVEVIESALLNMGPPNKKISAVLVATVIIQGDAADRVLDLDQNPEWQPQRISMVKQFPENEGLWHKYRDIRLDSLRRHGTIAEATLFYAQHQAEMDRGCKVYWDGRYEEDEISAIQHAMNKKFKKEKSFWAEYQNSPLSETGDEEPKLTLSEVCERINGVAFGVVPVDRPILTAYIDGQKKALPFVVTAWDGRFSGDVIAYGVYPDQIGDIRNFTLDNAHPTIAENYIGKKGQTAGDEGLFYYALEELCEKLLGSPWKTAQAGELNIQRLLIDAQWQTDVVYQFCRESKYKGVVMPSHGLGYTAAKSPMAARKRKAGEIHGLHWYRPAPGNRRVIPHVNVDTNFWKSFIIQRLRTAKGDPGALRLWGSDPTYHSVLHANINAEYSQKITNEATGLSVVEYHLLPNKPDNHFFDCLCGSAVAASMEGAQLGALAEAKSPRKRRVVDLSKARRPVPDRVHSGIPGATFWG